ncbi:MAG: ATP-binding protein [Candidatus Bipolaricaulota bacterium]
MLVTLGLSTTVAYFRQRESALASMSLLASQTGAVIEHALQRDMLVSDFEGIQSMFDAIGQDSRIRTLYPLDTTGRVVFAPRSEGVGTRLSNQDATCQPCHHLPASERPSGVVVTAADGQPVFRSMQPIENQPQCSRCHDPSKRLIGLLLTDLSIAPVEVALAGELRQNLAWWIGTGVLTAVRANLAVNRWVLRRLGGLASAIEDFGGGGIYGRAPEAPADEIGRLGVAFNTMADKIDKREAENRSLSEALRKESEERGVLLGWLISAQEEERKRVARELHDDLGQRLSSIALSIQLVQRAALRDPHEAVAHLNQAKALITEATDRMYDLVLGLRPSQLDDLGLATALKAHAQRTLGTDGVSFEIQTDGLQEHLPATIETALFRIFQEALNNVLRHAHASHVVVRISRDGNRIQGEVQDNGVGFSPGSLGSQAAGARGLGLLGMRERAAQLAGQVQIESRPGGGTTVRVSLRLDGEENA